MGLGQPARDLAQAWVWVAGQGYHRHCADERSSLTWPHVVPPWKGDCLTSTDVCLASVLKLRTTEGLARDGRRENVRLDSLHPWFPSLVAVGIPLLSSQLLSGSPLNTAVSMLSSHYLAGLCCLFPTMAWTITWKRHQGATEGIKGRGREGTPWGGVDWGRETQDDKETRAVGTCTHTAAESHSIYENPNTHLMVTLWNT